MLDELYQDISVRHFGAVLPAIPVLWEPDLARVGTLATPAFRLEGMFGHIGQHAAILLNPSLQGDKQALERALCHEMVHAYLYTAGDGTTGHGPAFQSVLRRLSAEAAFQGMPASDDERASLRRWLDAESARIGGERREMDSVGGDIERERHAVERALAKFNAGLTAPIVPGESGPSAADASALNARREAYNLRATSLNERLARDKADLAHFNDEVARYNLMLVYPDGVDGGDSGRPANAAVLPGASEAPGTSRQ
ncbi:MAG: SprT-like domain-containing protein [Acidobacteriota bacterium]